VYACVVVLTQAHLCYVQTTQDSHGPMSRCVRTPSSHGRTLHGQEKIYHEQSP
jgi:hypothetical protein